jgi:hypothetical protein
MLLLGERYVRAHILLSAIRFDFQTIAKRLICAFNADHHGNVRAVHTILVRRPRSY